LAAKAVNLPFFLKSFSFQIKRWPALPAYEKQGYQARYGRYEHQSNKKDVATSAGHALRDAKEE
jgi:hypothetical protein